MKLYRLPHWTLKLVQEYKGEFFALKPYLRAKVKYWNPQIKRSQIVDRYIGKYNKETQEWLLPLGLIDTVLEYCYQLEISTSHLEYPDFPTWKILPKWSEILRPEQYQSLNELLKYPSGIFRAYTGFGKTEVQLALLESYLAAEPHKALVLVPSKAILEEWKSRMNRYGLTSDRVTIIIPQGEAIRKVSALTEEDQYRLCIADEMHHLSAKTWQDIVYRLPNLTYSYGFSATPDPYGPGESDPQDGFPHQMTMDWALRVGLTGTVKVSISPSVYKQLHIKILVLPELVSDRDEEVKYYEAVERLLVRPELVTYLTNYLLEKQKTYFWPVPKIDIGRKLLSSFRDTKLQTVLWHADAFESYHLPPIKSISQLKELVSNNQVHLLITSQIAYEGVDFPEASGVVLGHGRNWRMNLQPLGRARTKVLEAILPVDPGNGMMRSQFEDRMDIFLQEYQIASIKELYIDKSGNVIDTSEYLD